MKLKPALVFGSHMVLQRQQPIHIWGTAAEGDNIYLTLGAEQAVTTVKGGHWQFTLPAREATTGLTMTIASQLTAEQVTFTDIAVGEVWLAGGQSNMQFMLRYDVEASEVIAESNDPMIRFFDYPEVTMPGQVDFGRTEEFGFWRCMTPADVPYWSAVGYYFARKLQPILGVPVGILGCNFGGSPAMAWSSREAILARPELKESLERYEADLAELDWQADEAMALNRALADPAIKRRGDDKILMGIFDDMGAMFGPPPKGNEPPRRPRKMVTSPKSANAPTVLYDLMLKPLAPYGIRGVIWYQGESDNGPKAALYEQTMLAVHESWNALWNRELPFYQVMLAPFDHWGPMINPNPAPVSAVRDVQYKLAQENENIYCVNVMDAGAEDNIHPRRKRPAGERLSLMVRKYTYGEDILADSPSLTEAEWNPGRVVLHFDHTGGALHVVGDSVAAMHLLVNGTETPALCRVEGETLVIESEALCEGAAAELQFARENFCEVNCYNAADLPIFPFIAMHQY